MAVQMLTPKMPTDPMSSQSRPETAFGDSWRLMCAAGHFDFEPHRQRPLPNPPPAGGLVEAGCQMFDGTAIA